MSTHPEDLAKTERWEAEKRRPSRDITLDVPRRELSAEHRLIMSRMTVHLASAARHFAAIAALLADIAEQIEPPAEESP